MKSIKVTTDVVPYAAVPYVDFSADWPYPVYSIQQQETIFRHVSPRLDKRIYPLIFHLESDSKEHLLQHLVDKIKDVAINAGFIGKCHLLISNDTIGVSSAGATEIVIARSLKIGIVYSMDDCPEEPGREIYSCALGGRTPIYIDIDNDQLENMTEIMKIICS